MAHRIPKEPERSQAAYARGVLTHMRAA